MQSWPCTIKLILFDRKGGLYRPAFLIVLESVQKLVGRYVCEVATVLLFYEIT